MRKLIKSLAMPFARPAMERLRARFASRAELHSLIARLDEHVRMIDSRHSETALNLSAQSDAQLAFAQAIKNLNEEHRATVRNLNEEHRITTATVQNLAEEHRLATLSLQQLKQEHDLSTQAIYDLIQLVMHPTSAKSDSLPVCVIITTCDRPALFERALTSVLRQSKQPEKIIVVDDGSTDASVVINKFAIDNVLLLKTDKPRSGASVAKNIGLDAADTELIAWLDDDNVMWPTWIERASAYLSTDSTLDSVYGAQLRSAETSRSDKFWFSVPFDFASLRQSNFVDINQLIHRRTSVRFDPDLRRLVDWDFLLRLIGDAPEKIARVPAIASAYSTEDSNRISVFGWPPYLTDAVENEYVDRPPADNTGKLCSCCGYSGAFLPGPDGRADAGCPQCGSLERHRFLSLIANTLYQYWVPETRRARSTAIEIAPSGATASLRQMFARTLTIDADPEADDRSVDIVASLTDLPLESGSADLIVALHVLEHIEDDRQAIREIARVLLPQGIAVIQVPLSGLPTTDEGEVDSVEERITRFGQADHVRSYGDDFFERLRDGGLETVVISPRQSMGPSSIARFGLLPDQALVFAVRTGNRSTKTHLLEFEKAIRKGAAAFTKRN